MTTDTLEARIYSAFPIIKIQTDEEPRLLHSLRSIARRTGKPLMSWSIASGLQVLEKDRNGLAPINSWSIDGLQRPTEAHGEDDENIDPEEM